MRAIALFLAPLAAACSTVTSEPVPPARVAVTFDQREVRPVVVEGLADRQTGRMVEANDPVRIASISKLVMALTALRLADIGIVDLDADVSDYLGWSLRHPAYPESKVTLAQLLMHRSGLRDNAGYVIPLGESLEAKLSDPAAWYAGAPPGEAPFEYANLGSPVVATVLEAATGKRYDRLVEGAVFSPLGVNACLNWIGCENRTAERAVILYRSTGEVARDDAADRPPNCAIPIAEGGDCNLDDYVPGTNASIFSPQGGVRIGMVDLAKIGQVIISEDEKFLSGYAFDTLKRSVRGSRGSEALSEQDFFCIYGLGFQAIQWSERACDDNLFADGSPRIGHAGEAYGLRSGLWIDPVGETGIAYFVTSVPDRTAPDEGGFAPEEVALVRRAQELTAKAGK